MRLSPRIIIGSIEQHLSKTLDLQELSCELILKRPVFVTDDSIWPKSAVCIAEEIPSSLMTKKKPADTLLLLKQDEHENSAIRQIDGCFILKNSCSLPVLFNELQELFNRYDEWDARLQTLLNRDDTLQSLLDASFPIFKNPLLLRGADFLLQARSGIFDESQELAPLIDPVNYYDTITTCKTDSLFLNSLKLQEPYILPEYLSGNRELCCNLFDHGIFTHRLILLEAFDEIQEAQGPLLAHLAEYVHLLLHKTEQNSSAELYPLERLLTDIISKKQTDYTIIQTSLAEYGWYSDHRYCCMTVRMSSMGSQTMTSSFLTRYFEDIIPGSCALRYDGSIIIFVNLSRYDQTVDGLLNNTTEFLRDSFLKTGISNPVTGVLDLRYCYTQSRIAIEYGIKYQPYRWIHKFEDITIEYFTECCLKELPVHMACSTRLLTLKEHDRTHNSDYYHTLKVYLESNLNAVQASRKLFIHRSTFLYRLEKIQELVTINFDDRDQLFYLMISYRILELKISDTSNQID